jgi:hypothetical protein
MKFGKSTLLAATLLALCGVSSIARSAPVGKVLIYINPQEYIYEHRIGGVGSGSDSVYWFKQGPMVEPIAVEALQTLFADARMCEAGMAADTIVWIRPSVVYNDQMTNFYGGIVANVYAGNGEFVASFEAVAAQSGFWDVYPGEKIKLAYKAAMQKVVQKMKTDDGLKNLLAQGLAAEKTKIPCSMVGMLPPRK